jgi:hypothetical protein
MIPSSTLATDDGDISLISRNSVEQEGSIVSSVATSALSAIWIDSTEALDSSRVTDLAQSAPTSSSSEYAPVALTSDEFDRFIRACEEGDFEGIQGLLTDQKLISSEQLERGVSKAVENCHVEIVVFLLSNGRTISQEQLSIRLRVAVRNSSETLTKFLLPLVVALREDDREGMILRAARRGWREILESLLQKGPIRRDVQESAISHATNVSIREMLSLAAILPEADIESLPQSGLRLEDTLYVTQEDVKNRPQEVLRLVVERRGFRRVVLLEQPMAVDLGGISQQIISLLIQSLIKMGTFPRTDEGLPLVKCERDSAVLWTLGWFYSFIFERNRDRSAKFLIGNLFHSKFLLLVQVVATYKDEDEKIVEIAKILELINPAYSLFTNVLLRGSLEDKELLVQALGLDGICEAEESAKEIVKEYIQAADSFFSGTQDAFREAIQREEAASLLSAIQGEVVTKESLIASLEMRDPSENLEKKVDWLKRKIASSPAEWQQAFLMAVTGKKTLTPEVKIEVQESWRENGAFEMHTCLNLLSVPRNSLSQADFLEALDAAILGEGYNIA